jgi:hypothetical protein
MEVNDQLHAPVALPPEKEPVVPLAQFSPDDVIGAVQNWLKTQPKILLHDGIKKKL